MLRVAIQGVCGSYSEEAVRAIFGDHASVIECADFETTFEAVRIGDADQAVVPVENKIVGEIAAAVGILKSGGFRVLERVPLRVQHVLAGTPDSDFEQLRSVRSHIEALRQCRNFLSSNPQLTPVVGGDTASSIRRIIREADPQNAAIGSRRAADLYGARILREKVADDIDNWTTFYLIGN